MVRQVERNSFVLEPGLSSRERKLQTLRSADFIKTEGGPIQIGSDKPLVCRLEKKRWNETPVRQLEVKPFWICKIKISNAFFEMFNPKHQRAPQSLKDNMPVVDVTYAEALRFCKTLNKKTNMDFRLPTEPEWMFAAAPSGWYFPYQPGVNPNTTMAHTYGDGQEHGCAPILDDRWETNYLGLDQMGHNVGEFTLGHYRTSQGQWGALDDGMYCIVKGGDWGHCSFSPRVNRRSIYDVADRNPRVGFRLAHNNV